MDKLLLKVSEVMQLIGVSRSVAYSLVGKGEIKSVRIGRSVRVPAAELESWVKRQLKEPEVTEGDVQYA